MDTNKEKESLNSIGWGLFLILLGISWIFPVLFPEGILYIGIGVILLLIGFFKHSRGFKVKTFPIFLGIAAILLGIGEYFEKEIPLLSLILIFWGVSIIIKSFAKKKNDPNIVL